MHEQTLISLLSISFLMGITHAFDADHIVAVSSLTYRKHRRIPSVFYAVRWALGHGGILLLIAAAALLFRVQLPDYIPGYAEKLVGVILIISGATLVWNLLRQKIHLHIHQHGDVTHGHLATPEKAINHDHAPALVGVVHGLAGSAPALALIPATLYQPSLGVGYVLIFSLGVLTGMLTFGLCLGHLQRFLQRRSVILFNGSRMVLGIGATVFGFAWLGII